MAHSDAGAAEPACGRSAASSSSGRDDCIMRGALGGARRCWLVLTVLLPLWALLSKSFQAADGSFVGLANFQAYFANPALAASICNSVWIAAGQHGDLRAARLRLRLWAHPDLHARRAACSG